LAKAIRKAVRGSYRLGKVMKDSIDAVLSVYYAEIKTNQKLIKSYEKHMQTTTLYLFVVIMA
ncbi:hypothetical protein CEE84_11985, partial [Lactobacillus crispatus]